MSSGRRRRGTDWRRATDRMPASYADDSRRGEPIQGRRHDDGLELVETVAAAAAFAAIAELATKDAPVGEEAVGVVDEDVVAVPEQPAAGDEGAANEEEEDED